MKTLVSILLSCAAACAVAQTNTNNCYYVTTNAVQAAACVPTGGTLATNPATGKPLAAASLQLVAYDKNTNYLGQWNVGAIPDEAFGQCNLIQAQGCFVQRSSREFGGPPFSLGTFTNINMDGSLVLGSPVVYDLPVNGAFQVSKVMEGDYGVYTLTPYPSLGWQPALHQNWLGQWFLGDRQCQPAWEPSEWIPVPPAFDFPKSPVRRFCSPPQFAGPSSGAENVARILPFDGVTNFDIVLSGDYWTNCQAQILWRTSLLSGFTVISNFVTDENYTFNIVPETGSPANFYKLVIYSQDSNKVFAVSTPEQGYYQRALKAGAWTMVANELDADDETLGAMFYGAPAGLIVKSFLQTNSAWESYTNDQYSGFGDNAWVILPRGVSAMVFNPLTNDIVWTRAGLVPETSLSIKIASGFSLLSGFAPRAGTIDELGFPAVDGDVVAKFLANGTFYYFQRQFVTNSYWVPTCTNIGLSFDLSTWVTNVVAGHTNYEQTHVWSPYTPSFDVGEGFLVYNTNATRTWDANVAKPSIEGLFNSGVTNQIFSNISSPGVKASWPFTDAWVVVRAPIGSACVLQSSGDLQSWADIDSFTVLGQAAAVQLPAQTNTAKFFRLQSAQ